MSTLTRRARPARTAHRAGAVAGSRGAPASRRGAVAGRSGATGRRLSATARALVAPLLAILLLAPFAAAGCGADAAGTTAGSLDVVATTTVLADIAQNVAGDRFTVRSLIPRDTDPHAFEPTPSDLRKVVAADLFVVNGGGLEGPLLDALASAGAEAETVDASRGLATRMPGPGEPPLESGQTDPHFWMDPTLVESYVATIRDAFAAADPAGGAQYRANAAAYTRELRRLDRRVAAEAELLPPSRRVLVTDHASLGYFADRYGFRVAGTVLPGTGSGDTPTARQLADLTATIRAAGVKAIFTESGEDPRLAQQIAAETGATVVTDLREHSLTAPGGAASTYVDMVLFDARRIVEALR